jgi:hypothetical protein
MKRITLTMAILICQLIGQTQDFNYDVKRASANVDSVEDLIITPIGFNRFFAKKSAALLGLESSTGLTSTYFKADLKDEKFTFGYNISLSDDNETDYSLINLGLSFDGNENIGILYSDGKWNEKFSLDFGITLFCDKSVFFDNPTSNLRERNGSLSNPAVQQSYMAIRRLAAFKKIEAELNHEVTIINTMTTLSQAERDELIEKLNEEKIDEWYDLEVKAFKAEKAYNAFSLHWFNINGSIQTSAKKYNLIDDKFQLNTQKQFPAHISINYNYYFESVHHTFQVSSGLGGKTQNSIDLIELAPSVLGNYIYSGSSKDTLSQGDELTLLNSSDNNKKVYSTQTMYAKIAGYAGIQFVYLYRYSDWKNKFGAMLSAKYYEDQLFFDSESRFRRLDLEFGIPFVLAGKDDDVVNIQLKGTMVDLFKQSQALNILEVEDLFSRKNGSFILGISVGIPIGGNIK